MLPPRSDPSPPLFSTDTYHVEGAGRLFEEPHQPALRKVLAAADSLLVGAHDIIRDRTFLQHVRRYVLQVEEIHLFYTPAFNGQSCNSREH